MGSDYAMNPPAPPQYKLLAVGTYWAVYKINPDAGSQAVWEKQDDGSTEDALALAHALGYPIMEIAVPEPLQPLFGFTDVLSQEHMRAILDKAVRR